MYVVLSKFVDFPMKESCFAEVLAIKTDLQSIDHNVYKKPIFMPSSSLRHNSSEQWYSQDFLFLRERHFFSHKLSTILESFLASKFHFFRKT